MGEDRTSRSPWRLAHIARVIMEQYCAAGYARRREIGEGSMQRTLSCPFFRKAFGWCVPIGGLGGLIGLGGGEFRLPVLMYGIGFDARSAVPLNLLTSLVTLSFALAVRSASVSLAAVVPHLPEMIGLLAGGMVSAFYGARLVSRLTNAYLVRLIAALL